MKKSFIPLVLLFGFLVFVPQIALADALYYSPEAITRIMKDKRERKEKKKEYNSCLQNYKSKLPTEYNGQNLKLEYKEIRKYLVNMWTKKIDYWFETKNDYFVDVDTPTGTSVLKLQSLVHDCETEYLTIIWWPPITVDVTNVQPGSHLKLVQGTDEVQVLPPNKTGYKIFNKNAVFEELYAQIRNGLKAKKERDLQCFNNKKPELTEYTGPNLKPENIESKDKKHCLARFSGFTHTLPETQNKYDIDFPKWHNTGHKSFVCDCEEYIEIREDGYKCYDVTNVPPNSRLEYIPKTQEMKVDPITIDIVKARLEKEFSRKDALMCLYNKKLNVPQKYTGPNLKLQAEEKPGKIFFNTGLLYSHAHTHKNPFPREFYNADVKFYSDDIRVTSYESDVLYNKTDCEEHMVYGRKYFDVTNVPHNSYLKYIPETEEIQVLLSENNTYKQNIKDKMKMMEKKAKEAQDSISTGDLKLMIKKLDELKKILDQKIDLYNDEKTIKQIVKQYK